MQFLVSCEHSSCQIPPEYKASFLDENILKSHLGWDVGAEELAKSLAKKLNAPLISGETSRLLVELNRSLHHPKLFSIYSKFLPKEEILNRYYFPYREKATSIIDQIVLTKAPAIHISVHTFTPNLNGKERDCDIGLLYDPKRVQEKELCKVWKSQLKGFNVRYNYPYRGTMDGFTTFLRKRYPEKKYLGIEVEVNQKFPLIGGELWQNLKKSLATMAGELLHLA